MSDFKTRLFDEKRQLTERIVKLDSFIKTDNFLTIDTIQQSLLRVQLQAMETYAECLGQRILALG
jgi:hypothetical protein